MLINLYSLYIYIYGENIFSIYGTNAVKLGCKADAV